MSHPSSCKDPACSLTYGAHLLSISVAPSALPTRHPHALTARTTERRWARDHAAVESLHKQGYEVPSLDGAACRADNAQNDWDIEHGYVDVDWEKER